jgi:hypothetical protein
MASFEPGVTRVLVPARPAALTSAFMQVVFRNLLAVSFLAWSASCTLDDHGLSGTDAGSHTGGAGVSGGGGTSPLGGAGTGALTGVAGSGGAGQGAAGDSAVSGAGGDTSSGAAGDTGEAGTGGTSNGEAGVSGASGTSGAAGDTGVAGTSGAAGTTGAAGTSGAAGTTGAAGTSGAAGITGAAGTKGPTGTAGTMGGAGMTGAAGTTAMGQIGCADGQREGYLDRAKYQKIAACSGAWEEPGLVSFDSKVPQCDRRGGDDGDRTDGRGCSVADLCASGWHVCESAAQVSSYASGCADATAPFGNTDVFFVTRQRGSLYSICDAANAQGTNNLYGCGNMGIAADKSCAPFTRMLRDTECSFPWQCAEGPLGTSSNELGVVTKRGSTKGGVLCCKD